MTAPTVSQAVHTAGTNKAPRRLTPLVPGLLLVVAGVVQGDGALITSAYRDTSPVSDERLSFPWDGATAVTTSTIWGVTQVLFVIGLLAFVRSGAVSSRAGRVGGAAAVLGASLFVPAHALSVAGHDALMDDTIGVAVVALFASGTLLQAVGLLACGVTTVRAGAWSGWARWTPLAVAVSLLALMPLQFTPLLAVAVGIYAVAVVALGLAMIQQTPDVRLSA